MTTVGYGDILPFTVSEKVYAIAIMLMGATVFGYIVGSVGTLATNANGERNATHNLLLGLHGRDSLQL